MNGFSVDEQTEIQAEFQTGGTENTSRPGLLIMCSSLYGGGAERVACRLANGLTDAFRVYYLYIRIFSQSFDYCVLAASAAYYHYLHLVCSLMTARLCLSDGRV